MDRRRLLALGAGTPFLAAVGRALAADGPGAPKARTRPGDPAWPDAALWLELASQIRGHLIQPQPLLVPCVQDPKGAACRARLKDLQNPYFIGDQPSGVQVSGYFNAWMPAPSAFALVAHSADDVAAGVRFARRHNLRLVVKGGAHSYHGTSSAPDSLMIWTRPMREVTVSDAFVPKGAPASRAPVPAVTAGAGAVWNDLYDAVTTKAGRYVQGGGCTTVGVAGHVQSGGFGSFSKGWGTSSGNLLEAEVVTADGSVRTANPYLNPDLFWGLKGGGGGSLGVVTRLTFRTHDLPETFGGATGRIKASSDDAYRRLVSRFLAFYAERLCNPHWGEQVAIQPDNVLKISMVSQGVSEAEATAIWTPFLDWVKAAPADYAFQREASLYAGPARGWWDVEAMRREKSDAMHYDERPGAPPSHGWWAGDQDQVGAYLHGYDSIWLQADLLKAANRERLAGALVDASRHFAVQLHFNKGLAGASPEAVAGARETAMNPEHLTAFALAIVATGGLPAYMEVVGIKPNTAFAERNAAAVAASAAALRAVAPVAGSYLSESDFFNADWRRAYWGSNYPRLRGVKARYDPDGLFFVHHGVGSEDWSADGFERILDERLT
jgi:FAD/FMN-containing dehydrogenase